MTREEAIAKIRYLEQQLAEVAPLPLTQENFPQGFNIQIRTSAKLRTRSTNWLNISAEHMHRIEEVLLDVDPTLLD